MFKNGTLLSFINMVKFLNKEPKEFFNKNNNENFEKLKRLIDKWCFEIFSIYLYLSHAGMKMSIIDQCFTADK